MAGNMAGGTHHAFREEGAGYCIFNDLAICAQQALLNSTVKKILILDLDVHQGDGTAKIFEMINGFLPFLFTAKITFHLENK
jgi:acetoin utilization deacetylase AcuC-like enzyme